jgi:hypothetical protein
MIIRTKHSGYVNGCNRLYPGGGGQAPAPTNQNVSQTTIPEYAQPQVERMLGKAEALSETPYQAYGGQRIAEFSPMQQQAFQGAANLGPAKQLGTATQMAGMAGLGSLGAGQQYAQQATNPYATQAYMSPYIQNALEPQMFEARRQSAMMGQQNQAQAVQQGAFGGSRSAIVEAERQRNLGQNLSNIYGTGMQNAFQGAQQAQQFGATLGLQGYGQAGQMAGTLGQLGQTQFGQQQGAMQAQAAAGGQQQAQEQQKLTQQYQDFLTQRGYPQQQLAFMSDILRGIPLGQQTQTQYMAPQSMASQAAQLGLGAYGISQLAKKEGGIIKGYAEGGAIKNFDEGGIASVTPDGYNVPPEKLMGMMKNMSTEQLHSVGQNASNAVTLGVVQAEMNRRQMMQDGQMLARSTPEGTVKDAMMGIDEAPIDERMFADTAVGETAPEMEAPSEAPQPEEGYAGGGGILAFKKGGDKGEEKKKAKEPSYIEQLAAQDVSQPVMSEADLLAAQQRGIAAKQAYMGTDETKGIMDKLLASYGESYSPEAKEQQKGLMALRAAAAFAPSEAGQAAPTFMGGLAKAGSGLANDIAEANKAERDAKRLMMSAQLDYSKAKRAEKAGDYEAGQKYAENAYGKKEAAANKQLEKTKILADVELKQQGFSTQLEAAKISAGPGYAAANKQTDFSRAHSAFMQKAMADFSAKNPDRKPTPQELATMNQAATVEAANAMKQYSGQIGQQKADISAQEKAQEGFAKWQDTQVGSDAIRRAKKADKEAGVSPDDPNSNTQLLMKRKQLEYNQMFGVGAPAAGQNPPPAGAAAPARSPADQQALAWAAANPTDPRAAEIKRRLGVQ